MSIPTVALQTGQKNAFVYVVGPDSIAHIRAVTPGISEKDRIEIVAGVQPGDKIVVDGQLQLSDGAPVHDTEFAGQGATKG